jgi:aspartate ammonia-lyase
MKLPSTLSRIETDSLGEVRVPHDALFGAQTMRATQNFVISGTTIGAFPELLVALALVKKAAATVNCRLGSLSEQKGLIIAKVCDELIAGQHATQFPVDMFQGGAGTSTNMNVNEVIANRALELMGHPCGSYELMHPNDDVNQSQSTNDVYPTAIRLAILLAAPSLNKALANLAADFEAKGESFKDVFKLGRTQLQDAVPMTLGQELHAYAVAIREDILRLNEACTLLTEVNLGGTAIGTGIAAHPAFAALVVEELHILSGLPVRSAENLIEASWDTGGLVQFSSVLKRIAVKLSKISNDLRLLSSGPRGGLGEIRLPAMQPGSSLMPGKVNPVIPEVVNQVAFQVIGADVTVTMASEAGQLQLNAFEPVIAYNLLNSLRLLTRAADTLAIRCVRGIEADRAACERNLGAGTALVTLLVPVLGYDRAAEIAKAVLASRLTLHEYAAINAMPDLAISALGSFMRGPDPDVSDHPKEPETASN